MRKRTPSKSMRLDGKGTRSPHRHQSEPCLCRGGRCCRRLDYAQESGLWLALPERIVEKSPEKPNPAVSESIRQSRGPRADRCEAGVFLKTRFLCSGSRVWDSAGLPPYGGTSTAIVQGVTGQEEVNGYSRLWQGLREPCFL